MSQQPIYEVLPRSPIGKDGAVFAALVIAALYFGRDILVPLALATLLGFVLTPPLQWLRRLRIPKLAAVAVVVGLAGVFIGTVVFVVGSQLVLLAEGLPGYQANIKSKLADLRVQVPGSAIIDRVSSTIEEIGEELSAEEGGPPGIPPEAAAPEPAKPVSVSIEPAPLAPLEVLQRYVGPVIAPIATFGLVVLFVVFILLEREELRDRFIALISAGDVQRSTEAIMDAGHRVSRYLLMQLVINATCGVGIGAGLWLIGVPNAILWGILATVLRFIPYLGPWLAAILPITLAFASDPGWTMVLLAIGLFLLIELLSSNVMEPWLYGATTGLSSFAIILAAIFWTLLWGPIGLLLATPLTVCLVVVGRYVPRLEFLELLLGSTPVLSPAERLYQRLLTGDFREASELTERALDTGSTAAFIEDVALPALRLAERDRERANNPQLRRNVADGMQALMEDVELAGEAEGAVPPSARLRIVCVGGRTELDQAAASLLAAYFEGLGHWVELKAPLAIAPGLINQLDISDIDLVLLCYLDRRPQRHARSISRRLVRQAPDAKVLVCCFSLEMGEDPAARLEKELAGKVSVATSMAAIERILATAGGAADEVDASDREATQEEALENARRHHLDAGRGSMFARLTDRLAEVLERSALMVALLDKGEDSAGESRTKQSSQSNQIARIVHDRTEEDRAPLIVSSVSTDPELSTNNLLLEKGIQFFAAAPIYARNEQYVGAVCLLDAGERALSDEQIDQLKASAEWIGSEISEPPGAHVASTQAR